MLSNAVIDSFLDRMSLAVRQAGAIAGGLAGRVEDHGKAPEALPHDTPQNRAQRAAKTLVDDLIQEVLLLAALETLDPHTTRLDAEEATPSVGLFAADAGDVTLVIDPLDGTLEYLAQQDSYSINVGLVHAGRMRAALICFPARDDLYVLAADGRSYRARQARRSGLANASPLALPSRPAPVIYKNSRARGEPLRCLGERGMTIVDDTAGGLGCAGALLKCLDGEASAYISHTRHMRDILLGAIVGAAEHGCARDWRGAALRWPASGRVPRAVFGCEPAAAPIFACLQRDAQ